MRDRQKKPYTPSDKLCKLWLQEKLSILRSAPSLNKKTRHFVSIVCMRNDSCLAMPPTIHCQPKLTSLDRDTIG